MRELDNAIDETSRRVLAWAEGAAVAAAAVPGGEDQDQDRQRRVTVPSGGIQFSPLHSLALLLGLYKFHIVGNVTPPSALG